MAKQQKSEPRPTRYIPIPKWNEHHPWPSPQGLRNRIHAAKRGVDPDFLKCVKHAGSRVLIDEAAFLEWIESQQSPDHAA